jgi:hypothetical protein
MAPEVQIGHRANPDAGLLADRLLIRHKAY